uniref:Uncharacterized protein n=1 Tax=Loa loa TaxID=7209 RepID=A0A1I7VEE6_LOALO
MAMRHHNIYQFRKTRRTKTITSKLKRTIQEKHNKKEREVPNKLKNHFELCFGRLKTLFKKLRNNEEILRPYDEIIQDRLQSGVIEEVYPDVNQDGIIHYLPDHEANRSQTAQEIRRNSYVNNVILSTREKRRRENS